MWWELTLSLQPSKQEPTKNQRGKGFMRWGRSSLTIRYLKAGPLSKSTYSCYAFFDLLGPDRYSSGFAHCAETWGEEFLVLASLCILVLGPLCNQNNFSVVLSALHICWLSLWLHRANCWTALKNDQMSPKVQKCRSMSKMSENVRNRLRAHFVDIFGQFFHIWPLLCWQPCQTHAHYHSRNNYYLFNSENN